MPDTERRFGLRILPLFLLLPFSAMPAPKIERLFLYDKQDNNLLKLEFHYAGGKTSGHTVFDKDGYLLYHTAYVNEGGGRKRESSTYVTGESRHFTAFSHNEDVKSMNIFNEFNIPVFQATYNTNTTDDNYQIKNKSGTVTHSMQYEYRDAQLSKINIQDGNGELTHYALILYEGQNRTRRPVLKSGNFISHIEKLPGVGVYVRFELESAQQVTAHLYDIAGTRLPPLINQRFEKGGHAVFLDINKDAAGKGIYVLRISLENNASSYKMKFLRL